MMAVVNVGEERAGSHRRASCRSVSKEIGAAGDVLAVSVQLEAEAAKLDPGERAELLEGLGLGEGALGTGRARRLRHPRQVGLPHDRRGRVPRLDLPEGRKGARMRRRYPFGSPARFHQGRRHPVGRAARVRFARRRPHEGQGPPRRQGLRRAGRRRARDPFQRLSADHDARPTCSTRWRLDLESWAIPDEILAATEESPVGAAASGLHAPRRATALEAPSGPSFERAWEALDTARLGARRRRGRRSRLLAARAAAPRRSPPWTATTRC